MAASAYEVFKLNTLLFPESSNVWDSLGELYYNIRAHDHALEAYRKSVEFDPGNQNGRRWIERIVREIGRRQSETDSNGRTFSRSVPHGPVPIPNTRNRLQRRPGARDYGLDALNSA